MRDEELEYESQNNLEEILYSMNTEEFSEEELNDQLNENIFSSHKTDYLSSYLQRYKFLKNEYPENEEFLNSLKNGKDELMLYIINEISEKFGFEIDTEHKLKKTAIALYDFFVINYKENLEIFFYEYIESNKKSILSEIKKNKRKKDISTVNMKNNFSNPNDAIIVDNIADILLNIIPAIEDEDWINYILDDDDTVTNIHIRKFIEEEIMEINLDTFNAFIDPFVGQEEGWSEVMNDIVLRYVEKNSNSDNDLDIFE